MTATQGGRLLLVQQMRWEAEDVLSIELVSADGDALPAWTVGSHVDLVLPNGEIRQYSLCGSPESRDVWRIAVLREPESTGGSEFIHTVLRPGMRLTAIGPRNNFPLVDAEEYLLIAGGIGVTPLIPMAASLVAGGKRWRMIYGGRRRASMAFLDELTRYDTVVVVPEDEAGLLDLDAAIADGANDRAVYCCGPERLISAVEERCAALGKPTPHVERFKGRPEHLRELQISSVANTEFDVVVASTGQRVRVDADTSIVDSLSEAGVFVPTSCTEGYCGVCQTEVLAGIPDHRDDYLSSDEREANTTMMVCCGRSKTPELVLNI